jgi:filamentous hemagglutinin
MFVGGEGVALAGEANSVARLSGEVSALENLGAARQAGRLEEVANSTTISELSPFTQRYLSEAGGRGGTTATREQNFAISQELEARGYTFGQRPGGGLGPEEYIPGPGPGTKGSTYVDITAIGPNGRTVRIQTVTTMADGVTPTASELAAAARIRAAFPNDKLLLVPKRQP